jgi:uncharacterized protein YybS (DUF2232 family)
MALVNIDNEKLKKLNLALLVFLTLIALVFSILMPGIGIVGAALVPLPATLLLLGGRIRDSIICSVLGIILLSLMDYIMAVVLMIVVIAIAFNYRNTVENNKSVLKTISVIFGIFCAAVFLYIALFSAINRVNYIGQALTGFNEYVDGLAADPMLSGYSSLIAVDSAQLDILVKQIQDIMRFIPRILPGVGVVSLALISMLNYIFSFQFFKRYRIELRPLRSFIKWDLPWYFCWGMIIGLVLLLVPSMGGSMDRVLDTISYNLLIIFGALYLVLGISVLAGLFVKFKLSFILRIVILALLGFFIGFTIFLVPLMGLIDIWANFRKLKRA